jgi:hypothetical protein
MAKMNAADWDGLSVRRLRLAMGSVGVLLLTACGSTAPVELSQQPATHDVAICQYPSGVATSLDHSSSGCSAGPTDKICQVSDGATIDADGGVTGGTESCQPLCSGTQYELSCRSAEIVARSQRQMRRSAVRSFPGPLRRTRCFTVARARSESIARCSRALGECRLDAKRRS